ncbi:MAG: hypothetical protein AAGN82_20420 [Myxococcota bacterium]
MVRLPFVVAEWNGRRAGSMVAERVGAELHLRREAIVSAVPFPCAFISLAMSRWLPALPSSRSVTRFHYGDRLARE